MEGALQIIDSNMLFILISIAVVIFIFAILLACLFVRVKKLKKRYEFFMGANRRPDYNLETMLIDYKNDVEGVHDKYSKLLETIEDIHKNIDFCTQKIGIVRYNPFDEMGGNLCFAVALLDANNNGVVMNGIHSRTGSFTYAKPIELGVSTYTLSQEEKDAVEEAIKSGYNPIEKTIKVDKPLRYYRLKQREKKSMEKIIKDKLKKEINAKNLENKNNDDVIKDINTDFDIIDSIDKNIIETNTTVVDNDEYKDKSDNTDTTESNKSKITNNVEGDTEELLKKVISIAKDEIAK